METALPHYDEAEWLSSVEAAALVGVTGDTIRRAVADGRLPGYRLFGIGRLRILRADLDAHAMVPGARVDVDEEVDDQIDDTVDGDITDSEHGATGDDGPIPLMFPAARRDR